MTINKDLLRETLAYIEAHPEEWDQTKWLCGTTACFAGRACLLSGDRPVYEIGPDDESGRVYFGQDNRRRQVRYRAADLLGLGQHDADVLFDCGCTMDDLRRIVAELCARDG